MIHQRWVLTAGHCVIDSVKIEVYLGAVNRDGDGREGSYIKFMAATNRRSIILHENYNDRTLVNDIALVELPQDAPTDHAFIGLLEIPSGVDRTNDFINFPAIASGFGELRAKKKE